MKAALPLLQTNDCDTDCSSTVCKTQFGIIQAHHDYCLGSDVPEEVEAALHIYEDTCESCEIVRLVDPNLPECPAVVCNDGSGNDAYNKLVGNGCGTTCTAACADDFRILKAVHDTCEEDSLDTAAELAFHTYEEACEDFNCNILTEEDQLECHHDEGEGGDSAAAGNWHAVALLLVSVSGAWTALIV